MSTTSAPDYARFFHDYAAAYERSLGERVDSAAVRGFYAESFIAASLAGAVRAGANDDEFERTLQQGYGFYKAIGTRQMRVRRVEAVPLCEQHDRVTVSYEAGYEKRSGEKLTIPFDITYLLQRRDPQPKIFGFIAGDEMALYREHGLVDAKGQPAA